ncbi:hypothetical protein KEJ50_05815 [Candidatus Bathyarchaeota archaeon]|nr:hypothetical protein [Candidatus Bathyarchaeota archaeon]
MRKTLALPILLLLLLDFMLFNQPTMGAVNASARVVNDRWYLDVDDHPIVIEEVENTGDVALREVKGVLLIH